MSIDPLEFQVIAPAVLFAALSPATTDIRTVSERALMGLVAYYGVACASGLALAKNDLVVPAVLSICINAAIPTPSADVRVLKGIAFAAAYASLRTYFPQYY